MLYLTIVLGAIAVVEFVILSVSKGMRNGERGIKSELISQQTDLIRETVAEIMSLQKYSAGKAGLRQIRIYANIIDGIAGQGSEE